jgi:hypothetical protein
MLEILHRRRTMEEKNGIQSSGQKISKQLPLVTVSVEDVKAVKAMLSKFLVPEGSFIDLTAHEMVLKVRYFDCWTPQMMRDLHWMWEDMRTKGYLSTKDLKSMTVAPPMGEKDALGNPPQPLRMRVPDQEYFSQSVQEAQFGTTLGRVVAPIFSPTIDEKTFQLPRLWWLRPWSTIALLGGRLETLAKQYDADMAKVMGKLDASDRAVLKQSGRSDDAHKRAVEYAMTLKSIASQRNRTKNGSIGRKMVEAAEETLARNDR